jgi:hypothetical protein
LFEDVSDGRCPDPPLTTGSVRATSEACRTCAQPGGHPYTQDGFKVLAVSNPWMIGNVSVPVRPTAALGRCSPRRWTIPFPRVRAPRSRPIGERRVSGTRRRQAAAVPDTSRCGCRDARQRGESCLQTMSLRPASTVWSAGLPGRAFGAPGRVARISPSAVSGTRVSAAATVPTSGGPACRGCCPLELLHAG